LIQESFYFAANWMVAGIVFVGLVGAALAIGGLLIFLSGRALERRSPKAAPVISGRD